MADSKINSVLIVDDEGVNTTALENILSQEYKIYTTKNGLDAISLAKERHPDVILLDILMPGIDGYETLSRLKSDEDTQPIPVILITGLGNIENEEKGFILGAADYICKPCAPSIVKLRIKNQINIVNQLRLSNQLSTTDQLTGIPNRRSFNIQVNKEWGRNMRDKKPLSLILLDIDRFKDFNDTYGHQQGDEVLRTIATTLKGSLRRSSDFAARWGGEEFVILLPSTDMNGALIIAERIRENIEQTPIPVQNGLFVGVTVSIGVAMLVPTQETNQNDLISQADRALYDAKEKGRNKVCEFDASICGWPVYDNSKSIM
jgi:diguanylate cyclase (GGDEF)-like protein